MTVVVSVMVLLVLHDMVIGDAAFLLSPVIAFWFTSGAINRFNKYSNGTQPLPGTGAGAPDPTAAAAIKSPPASQ
jgi:hypothetical protein